MTELEKLKEEAEPWLNTLVLSLDKVVRLIGVEENGDDYYWVYEGAGGIYRSSCVIGWTRLKGSIPDEDYDRLVRVWNC